MKNICTKIQVAKINCGSAGNTTYRYSFAKSTELCDANTLPHAKLFDLAT